MPTGPLLSPPSYFGSSTGTLGGGLPVKRRDEWEEQDDEADVETGTLRGLQGLQGLPGPGGQRLSRTSSEKSMTPPSSSASVSSLRFTNKRGGSSGEEGEGGRGSRPSDEGGDGMAEVQKALQGTGMDAYRRTGSGDTQDSAHASEERRRVDSQSTSTGGQVGSGAAARYEMEDTLAVVEEGGMHKTGRLRRFTNMLWPVRLTGKPHKGKGGGRRNRRRRKRGSVSVGSIGDFASRGSSESESGADAGLSSMGLEMRQDDPHTAASRRQQRAAVEHQQQFDSELQRYGRGRPGLEMNSKAHQVHPMGPSTGAGGKGGMGPDSDLEAGLINNNRRGVCSCLRLGGEGGEELEVMLGRVWFGILLSVIERPEPTNVGLQFFLSRVYPAVYLAFQFLQLSATNNYLLPPLAIKNYSLSDLNLFNNIVYLTIPTGAGLSFVTGAAVMAALLLFVAVLALQFRKAEPSRLVIDPLAGLLSFFSTIYYMPFIENMSKAARVAVENGDPLRALVSMLCLLLFVPFCLFVSQNKFRSDVNSAHLLSRRHNRVTLVLIAVKTGAIFTTSPSLAWVRLLLLLWLFLSHFLSYPYYSMLINRLVNGLYAVLVLGGACRLIDVLYYHKHIHDPTVLSRVDRAYWWLLLPVFLLGLSLALTTLLGDTREAINDWVMENVNLFDMADRAEVIERFGYSYLLHSATRMGRHARFLARAKMRRKLQKDARLQQQDKTLNQEGSLETDEGEEEEGEENERGGQDAVEAFFHKALIQDPQHAQNLAWYGDYKWLVKGELEEARALYERAVRAQPRNRHLLESLAHFLNANPGLRFAGPQSLACYQKAVQQHRGHSKYSKFYVNSSDPALIISSRGQILDCNGAALHVFRCRGRSDLCGKRRLFGLLHAAANEAEVRQLTDALRLLVADKVPSARLQTRVATLRGQHLDVQMLLTVVYRGRGAATGSTKGEERTILYAALSDVTEMKALLETNRLVFENSQTCMIMVDEQGFIHKYNKHAEQTFGYRKSEMEGSPDGRVPRANISRLLSGGIAYITAQHVPPLRRPTPEPLPTDETGRPLSAAAAAGVASPLNRDSATRDSMAASKSPCQTQKGSATGEGVEGQGGTDDEVHVKTKRGGVRTCLIRVKDLVISGTNYYIVTLNDISNLKEAMELNVRVFEDSLLPMLMLDATGRIQRLNKAAVTMTGYPADRLQHEHFKMLLDYDWSRQHEGFFRKYFQGRSKQREVTCDKVPFMTALQEARLCTLKLSEIRAGNISLFLLLLLDMTEMHSLNLRNELTFELAMVAMILVDKNGLIETWNKQATDTFQYSAKEVHGRGIDLIFARHVTNTGVMRRSPVGGGSFASRSFRLSESGNDDGLSDLLQPRIKSREGKAWSSGGERLSDVMGDSGKDGEEAGSEGEEDKRPAFMARCGGLMLGAENEVLLRRQDGQIRACVVRVNDMVLGNDKVLYIFCITDVTDMKEAHELSDKVFDKSMTPMFMMDESGHLQRINQAATALTQYSDEEALNMSIKEFLEPEVAKHQDMFLRRLKVRKGPRRIRSLDKELKLRVRDGTYRTCKLQLSELEVGVYRYFVGMLIDVSQLKELNELSEKTFQNALAPMFTLSPTGTIKAANKKAHQIFGFSTDYLLSRGLSMDVFMPPSSSSPPRHSIVDGHTPPRSEARSFMSVYGRPSFRGVVEGLLLTRQGRQRGLFTIRTSEVKVADKRYYVCCLQDVTALREAAETNRLIFEKSGTAMMILTPQGVITRVNEGAMSMFGFASLKEAEGRQLASLCLRPTEPLLCTHYSTRHLVDGNKPTSPKRAGLQASQAAEPVVASSNGRRPSLASAVNFEVTDEDLDPRLRAILLHGKDKGDYEIKMLSLDGQELSCLARISRMTTPSTSCTPGSTGVGNGFILTLEDITRVKEAHKLQSQIFELGSEPMIMLSETGVIEDYNIAAEDAFGYSKDETLGENITMLMADQKHVMNHHSYLKHYVSSGDRRMLVAAKEVTVKTKEGRCRVYSVKVSELWVAKTRRFVGIFHDITELPNLNSTSRLAYKRYEEERSMRPEGDPLTQSDKDVWNTMVQEPEPLLSGSIRARIPSSPLAAKTDKDKDKPPSPAQAAHHKQHATAPIVTDPHPAQPGGPSSARGSRSASPASPAGEKKGNVSPS